MNYAASFGNFVAELAMHLVRYFLLWLAYKYVITVIIVGLPEIGWQMGVLVYALLALAFTINLKVGSD